MSGIRMVACGQVKVTVFVLGLELDVPGGVGCTHLILGAVSACILVVRISYQ